MIAVPSHVRKAGNVGDINNDGFDDFALGLHIVSGSSDFLQADSEQNGITLIPTLLDGYGGDSVPIHAGDVNGDGIDDLVFNMFGPISDSTASGKETAFVRNGVNIVFGSPNIFDNNTIDVATLGRTIRITTNYYERAETSISDVNRDGIQDIILQTSGREFVILGGPDLADIDLGLQYYNQFESLKQTFNGSNGFATTVIANPRFDIPERVLVVKRLISWFQCG